MQVLPHLSHARALSLGAALLLLALTPLASSAENIDQWILKAQGKALLELRNNTATSESPIPGAANGTVIASPSKSEPDYFYHWVRDGALVMDVFVSLFEREPE